MDARIFRHHDTCHTHARRFHPPAFESIIADQGIRKNKNLPGVGRISQGFGVSGEGRCKNQLAARWFGRKCAKPGPPERETISEGEGYGAIQVRLMTGNGRIREPIGSGGEV